jgi:hypothetical protein
LIVFELSPLDQDFLAFGGDTRKGEDLEFEGRAGFCRVDFDVELFALPFYNDCTLKRTQEEEPGMVAMMGRITSSGSSDDYSGYVRRCENFGCCSNQHFEKNPRRIQSNNQSSYDD